jgi:inosose dehydratase
MERPTALTRRDLVQLGVSALALSPLAGGLAATRVLAADPSPNSDPFLGLRVGVATYTFSRVPLEKTIRDIKQVGVQYVSIKEAHLPLKSTAEQRKEVVKKFKEAGITPLSCGNIAMKDDESAVRNAFEYARDAGIPTIVCTPVPQILPLLDKLV